MREAMITTEDNPFDPFNQYDEWFAFDQRMQYHTPSYLARVVVTSDELSQPDQQLAIETAIDEIVAFNLLGKYKKVVRETEEVEM